MKNADLTGIVSDILSAAKLQAGVTAVEVGGSLNSGLSTTVRLGQVDTVEFHRDKSIGITIYKDKRKGSVSITDLSTNAVDSAIKAACRIAEYTEPDPYAGLADQDLLATDIQDLQLYHPAAVTPEQAIGLATECEAAALAYDKRITNSDGATFNTHEQFYVYGNSNGFLGAYPTSKYAAYCSLIGQQGSAMQSDYDFTIARDINDLASMQEVGVKAAEKTVARLGARKIATCSVPVLLTPKIAGTIWGTLISAISGGNLYRKSSFLIDSLQQQLFPTFVNITEQPHLLKVLGSAPFDNEGVMTRNKNIIKSGLLETYLLSSYSARHLNMQTTGNAGGVHNFIVSAGDDNFAAMLKKLGTGLMVTDFLGHGANIVTGDFSQGAAGFWVENGVIQYPVEEITVAGNLRDMFKNLVAVGSDIDWRGNIVTGSVLLDKLVVGGS